MVQSYRILFISFVGHYFQVELPTTFETLLPTLQPTKFEESQHQDCQYCTIFHSFIRYLLAIDKPVQILNPQSSSKLVVPASTIFFFYLGVSSKVPNRWLSSLLSCSRSSVILRTSACCAAPPRSFHQEWDQAQIAVIVGYVVARAWSLWPSTRVMQGFYFPCLGGSFLMTSAASIAWRPF